MSGSFEERISVDSCGSSDVGGICVYPEQVWDDQRGIRAGSVSAYVPGTGIRGGTVKEPDVAEDAEESRIQLFLAGHDCLYGYCLNRV